MKKLLAIVAASAMFCLSLALGTAQASPGDPTVSFLVPISDPHPVPVGIGATVIFTGQPTGTISDTGIGTCFALLPGSHLIYDVTVLVSPRTPLGFTGSDFDTGRDSGVVVTFPTSTIPPGTRVGDLQGAGVCSVGSAVYAEYSGVVK
jgi:hypothetical protein